MKKPDRQKTAARQRRVREHKTMARTEKYGNVELRFQDGELDEIVIADAAKESSFFLHIEKMSTDCFWAGIDSSDGKHLDIYFESASPIRGRVARGNAVNGR